MELWLYVRINGEYSNEHVWENSESSAFLDIPQRTILSRTEQLWSTCQNYQSFGNWRAVCLHWQVPHPSWSTIWRTPWKVLMLTVIGPYCIYHRLFARLDIPENHGPDSSLRKISDISQMKPLTFWINYWDTIIKNDLQHAKRKHKPTLVCGDRTYTLSIFLIICRPRPDWDPCYPGWRKWFCVISLSVRAANTLIFSPHSCTSQVYIDSLYLVSPY